VENKGVKGHINKTNVVISGESCKGVQHTGGCPCGICVRGVDRNSVHKTCIGVKGGMIKGADLLCVQINQLVQLESV